MVIFNQAIKRILGNKLRLVVLLLMPLLFIAMFALQEERSLTIGIVDKDNSMLSNKLTTSLSKMQKVKTMSLIEAEVYDKTVSYQTDYTIIIEQGFEESLIKGEKPTIFEFYLHEKEKLFYAKNHVESFILNLMVLASGANHDKPTFYNLLKTFDDAPLHVVNEQSDQNKVTQTRQALGFLVQFLLYMSVITASLILEDKSSGVYYRTFYAPITLKRYLTENLLAFLSVAITQVALILVLLKTAYGLEFGNGFVHIFLTLIIFSIVCISLGMWLISLFRKPLGAHITIILLTTPLVMLGGCYWPMEFMPELLQQIALLIPTTWVMSGIDQILYKSKSINDISLNVLVLLLFAGVFLASGLFKKIDISK